MGTYLGKNISELSNEELKEIIYSPSGSYSADIIEQANNELKRRSTSQEQSTTSREKQPEAQPTVTNAPFTPPTPQPTVSKKYPALRFVAGVYYVFAMIDLVVTIVLSIMALINPMDLPESMSGLGVVASIIILIPGLLIFLFLLAISEAIKVFIDIEHNTRITAVNSQR